jgi:hypothetical protein
MKKEVEILYLDYHKDDAKSTAEAKVLKGQLNDAEQELDSLKNKLGQLD